MPCSPLHFGHSEQIPTQTNEETDWVDDLKALLSTGSITEPKSDVPPAANLTTPISHLIGSSKAPFHTGSITKPKSDDLPAANFTEPSKAPLSTGSITEPKSDDPPAANLTVTKPESDGSITELESDDITMVLPVSKSTARLDCHCMFVTPSPPPPSLLYWKYFTKEEDARMYDHSGTDESFQAVQQMKKELQALMDA
ncbi:hypothetical protein BDR04DRAFT_1159172 [Suillus decipiens]|nr:hypothetical protein BDR04DRAFT_1159172 [Suillus decipiens]